MSADGSVLIVFPTRVIPLAHYDWATQEGAKSTSPPPALLVNMAVLSVMFTSKEWT